MAGEVARSIDDLLRIQNESPAFITRMSQNCKKLKDFFIEARHARIKLELEANTTFEGVLRAGMLSNVKSKVTRAFEKGVGKKEKTQSIGEISRRFQQVRGDKYKDQRNECRKVFSTTFEDLVAGKLKFVYHDKEKLAMGSLLKRRLKKEAKWGVNENLNNILQCYYDEDKTLDLVDRKVNGLLKGECQALLTELKIPWEKKDLVLSLKNKILDYKWKQLRKEHLDREKVLDAAAGIAAVVVVQDEDDE